VLLRRFCAFEADELSATLGYLRAGRREEPLISLSLSLGLAKSWVCFPLLSPRLSSLLCCPPVFRGPWSEFALPGLLLLPAKKSRLRPAGIPVRLPVQLLVQHPNRPKKGHFRIQHKPPPLFRGLSLTHRLTDAGISSSAKSVIFLFFFPDFAPPLAAKSAALFACSRAFRLSDFARLTTRAECLLWGGGIDFLLAVWEAPYAHDVLRPPKSTWQDISKAPRVTQAGQTGQTGPRQCSGTTQGGATWKCAVSQGGIISYQVNALRLLRQSR
jgi:hypothetical protein